MAKYDFEELRHACSGHWETIIRALSEIDVSRALETRKHVKCPPGHGGKTKRQFRVFPDFDATGGGVCNVCGNFYDGFALLTYLNRWDRKKAVKEVARFMEDRGYRPRQETRQGTQRPPPKPVFEVKQESSDALSKVWSAGVPLKGTLGETYLRERGVKGELPNTGDVRFHPNLHYWDADEERSLGYFPAIISMVKSSKAGHPLTIHRTYLDHAGGKAKVSSPKKLMPCAVDRAISELGAAIRLYKLSGPLMAVTEGLENATAIREAHPTLPVWAAVSANILTKFRPPYLIKMVQVFGDVDASGTGQAAAATLALRLEAESYRVRICLPARRVALPRDASTWYGNGPSRDQIQCRLEQDGYEVVEACSSIDWLDIWNNSKDILLRANYARSAGREKRSVS